MDRPIKSPPTLATPPDKFELYPWQQALLALNRQLVDAYLGIVQPLQLTLFHGTESRMDNPLPGRRPIKGAWPVDAAGVRVTFRNIDANGNTYIGDSPCPYVGLTAFYPAYGALHLKTPTTTTVASGSNIAVSWTGVGVQRGSTLSWSNSANTKITVNAAGDYEVFAHVSYTNSALGSTRWCEVRKNGTRIALDVHGAGTWAYIPVDTITYNCAVGDYFELFVNQDTGGTISFAEDSNCIYLGARQVEPSYSQSLTLNLW